MKGTTPASWYVAVNGQAVGPYTSQQIMQQLMDGALKVESQVYDVQAKAWKLAADVVPYLNLDAPATSHNSNWQPPPKPPELRDVHVVDLNIEPTGGIDYFALIGDRKKELEIRARQKASRAQETVPQNSRTASAAPRSVQVVKAPAESTDAKLVNEAVLHIDTRGPVLRLVDFIGTAAVQHKKSIGIAASLALVFAGTFGVIRTLSDRGGRVPAALAPTPAPSHPVSMAPRNSSSQNESIGSGRHRGRKNPGHDLVPAQHARIPETTPPPTPSSEPTPEPAQFISSSDPSPLTPDVIPGQPPLGQPLSPPHQPTPENPNNGLVDGVPPFAAEAENDPNRFPSGGETPPDPNQTPTQ